MVDYSPRDFKKLDRTAEANLVQKLQYDCEVEVQGRNRMTQEAQGWFFQDVDKMREARELEMRSCRRLDELHVPRGNF